MRFPSSNSRNRLVFRYPILFCGPEVTPLFHTQGDYSGWKRFAQLFNPLSTAQNIVVSFGNNLSMIPRCIEDKKETPTGETSAFALVLLVNNTVVNESFSMKSFEDCTTYVACISGPLMCSSPSVCSGKRSVLAI